MAGQKMETGPTAKTVADNIKRVREEQRLTYTDVSRQLGELGRNVSPLAVRRMEEGERRVDVDDLMSLAVALNVTPISLLTPDAETAETPVQATGTEVVQAKHLWDWMRAEHALEGPYENVPEMVSFFKIAAPEWRRTQVATGMLKLIELRQEELKVESGGQNDLERVMRKQGELDGDD